MRDWIIGLIVVLVLLMPPIALIWAICLKLGAGAIPYTFGIIYSIVLGFLFGQAFIAS